MIYLIIGGCVLACAIFIAMLPKIVTSSRIVAQAREDYMRCRGTHHMQQILTSLNKHEAALRSHQTERDRVIRRLDSLAQRESEELKEVFVAILVRKSFLQIPGIGPTLRDRIVQTCFDGTLESLSRAYQVHGVGQEKGTAVRHWVHEMKRRLPALLRENFNGKKEIREKYITQEEQLKKKRDEVNVLLNRRENIIVQAQKHLEPLQSVTKADFRKALRGDRKAAARVADHAIGAFAEWETLPDWFAGILKEPRNG